MGELLYFMDFSNYQSVEEMAALIADHNPDGVFIRMSDETAEKRGIAVAQCRRAADMGKLVSGYSWPYAGEDPAMKVQTALSIAADAGLPGLGMLLLDCEEGSIEGLGPAGVVSCVNAYAGACMAVGLPMMVYTRRDWWQQYAGDRTDCSWLYLCVADYDGVAELSSRYFPFSGWTQLAGKQWSDNPDRIVLDSAIYSAGPVPVPVPPDPCQPLKQAVRAELARKRIRRKKLAALVA